ncbi:DUF6544 family protein [Pararhodonellum marinum]|uniref:DUF6544 family protein n=1 Tax=Pararhodonellum marinum TaxID=2755358 RepID=UPI0018902B3C|nr:DUF6544 family protein [Pararhodonellum marinum]
MRIAFFILIIFHALIHLLGFVKGYGLKEVKELTLPISKVMGFWWLTAAGFILIYGISQLFNSKYAWLIGFVAVAISQTLVFMFWKDAKFGTLPNIAILLVSLMTYGNQGFKQLVQLETNVLLSKNQIMEDRVISEDDIKELPQPVRNWLQQSGVIGRPYISVGKVIQKAEMKLKPEQDKWFKAEAVQYSTIDVPAFIWTVDVKMNGLLSFQGRDKFENGKGEMLIKLNSLFNVVNEKGFQMNESTMQRYLGEMVWFPSLALSPYITWQEVTETSATATMEYKGTKGSGTFYFNADGDFVRFSALRYKGNEANATRNEWVLLVENYKTFDGIRIPSLMTATWKLEEGDWTWLKLEIIDLKFNEQAR